MTKDICFVLFLVLFVHSLAASQEYRKGHEYQCDLRIIIDGFANDNGIAMIDITNSKGNYLNMDNHFKVATATIKGGVTEHTFKDLPYGEYAVKVFHDKNNNRTFDRFLFGIPLERYGFSNNARAKFGPPKWEDARINLDSKDLTIHITIK